jgi:hypothetical protein
MRRGGYAEPDDAEEGAMLQVAHCAASEAVLGPQPLLAIQECLGFGTIETPLVLEPPDPRISEDFRQLVNVAVSETAY